MASCIAVILNWEVDLGLLGTFEPDERRVSHGSLTESHEEVKQVNLKSPLTMRAALSNATAASCSDTYVPK